MNKMQGMVRDFHWACDIPAPEILTMPDPVRADLILEEAQEFQDAYKLGDLPAMIDALCDILYVTFGAGVAMGVDLQPFFNEVHRANMQKTKGPKREDGKQLKPEGWQPPRIEEMLNAARRIS